MGKTFLTELLDEGTDLHTVTQHTKTTARGDHEGAATSRGVSPRPSARPLFELMDAAYFDRLPLRPGLGWMRFLAVYSTLGPPAATSAELTLEGTAQQMRGAGGVTAAPAPAKETSGTASPRVQRKPETRVRPTSAPRVPPRVLSRSLGLIPREAFVRAEMPHVRGAHARALLLLQRSMAARMSGETDASRVLDAALEEVQHANATMPSGPVRPTSPARRHAATSARGAALRAMSDAVDGTDDAADPGGDVDGSSSGQPARKARAPPLLLRIPETVVVESSRTRWWLGYDAQTNSVVRREAPQQQWTALFDSACQASAATLPPDCQPVAAVIKVPHWLDPQVNTTSAVPASALPQRLSQVKDGATQLVVQQYVRAKGAGASVYRVVWRQEAPPAALCIANRTPYSAGSAPASRAGRPTSAPPRGRKPDGAATARMQGRAGANEAAGSASASSGTAVATPDSAEQRQRSASAASRRQARMSRSSSGERDALPSSAVTYRQESGACLDACAPALRLTAPVAAVIAAEAAATLAEATTRCIVSSANPDAANAYVVRGAAIKEPAELVGACSPASGSHAVRASHARGAQRTCCVSCSARHTCICTCDWSLWRRWWIL